MKSMRKVVGLMLAMAMFLSIIPGKQILAAVKDDSISIMTINTATISMTLSIASNGATECNAVVDAHVGTSKITGTLKLQKVTSSSTTTVKSWNVTSYTDMLDVTKTCFVLSKGTYKLVLKVTVTRNGKSETLTAYTTKKYS